MEPASTWVRRAAGSPLGGMIRCVGLLAEWASEGFGDFPEAPGDVVVV